MKRFTLVKKTEIRLPTLWGWLVVLAACAMILGWFVHVVHPFFAVTDPRRGTILVVEGWLPRYALERAARLFEANGYERIMTTGGPILSQLPCSDFKTYAELGAAVLKDFRVDAERIVAVPAPEAKKDRTYISACALGERLRRETPRPASLDILTLGPHARRSRILFQKALGSEMAVGVISVPNRGYDPDQWWRYSQGVKTVINEIIGYLYTRLVFRPAPPAGVLQDIRRGGVVIL